MPPKPKTGNKTSYMVLSISLHNTGTDAENRVAADQKKGVFHSFTLTLSGDTIAEAAATQPAIDTEISVKDRIKGLIDKHGDAFKGKKVMFFGALPNLNREEAKKLVINFGGVVRDDLENGLDFAIVGNRPGKKCDGIDKKKIMYEEGLLKRLEENQLKSRKRR